MAGSLALSSSLALIAAAPGSWLAVVPSAVLFGAAYNVLLAVDAIWSAEVFAGRPATGLAAVMFVLAIGLLLGPAGAGVMGGVARPAGGVLRRSGRARRDGAAHPGRGTAH